MFSQSIVTCAHVKDVTLLFNLLEDSVWDICEQHTMEVVIDNAINYVAYGKMLMEGHPTLSWTPCSAYCVVLMLEGIDDIYFITKVR